MKNSKALSLPPKNQSIIINVGLHLDGMFITIKYDGVDVDGVGVTGVGDHGIDVIIVDTQL